MTQSKVWMPKEIHDRLRPDLFPKESVIEVEYFSKSLFTRDSAWSLVLFHNKPHGRNRWKKCHTENYWVWFRST